ncbi:Acg family FMN-binding oxidoreductase [Parerythrobacter jejuensis]|uniref:Twin-arginine translocation pathway signal protein n=1 Tax=Parerythrobacter jejuensis TaxID=795812 RepID=A0A845ATP1_9SPHN|nr:twin-arginine translocation pathway signal protein [Parerythrobacter jejuensis]MXP31876.1 twin-arginine translocation pathway signal protein [Parerythrobacter jejuensis]
MVSRRKFLAIGGAGALVVLGAGAYSLLTPSMSRAREPWRKAGQGFGDPRLNALSFAILAPNPHNRQPWEFTLVGEDAIDVRIDLDKRLPETDPFNRQITIGFGCMIELLRIAAAQQGFDAQIDPFPDGEGQPLLDAGRIARIRLVPGGVRPDPLFESILARRSVKEPYADRPVSNADLAPLIAGLPEPVQGGATGVPERVTALRENAMRAWTIEYETDATRRESIDLMRIGNDAAVARPDGIDLAGPVMSAGHAVGLVTKDALDTPGTTAFESGYDMYQSMIDATPAFVWLTTQTNTRTDQLAAGAAWVRLNLAATQAGLAVHPWSQALQEFPEMAGPYKEIHSLLAPEGGTVQMFARAGFGPAVDASPRWPLEAKLTDA